MSTATEIKYSCQVCSRDDLTLTRNGRVRSHAADGKRASATNPACGGGSTFPVQSTGHHEHRFTYADDGNGHEGSFCTVDDCGMVEPEDNPVPPTEHTHDFVGDEDECTWPGCRMTYGEYRAQSRPVPPNPFRDPAPGGVWDVTGTGRPEIPRRAPERFADVIKEVMRPAGPVSAADFLDGVDDDYEDSEPADDGGPSYWPARYDGTCTTCLAHFDEGDLIRKIDGQYEAKDCCGEGAAPRPEVPKAVARTLPVVRGRYQLPDPQTGKRVIVSRASKFAEGIADSFALDQWRHRMILVGVTQDPEILEKVMSALRDKDPLDVVKAERDFLNRRAEEAMSAAGGDKRSGAGTKSHKYTEEVDAGQRALADVPEEFRVDIEAYAVALAECGFRPVKGLIERSVYSAELKVCGTFDRVLECVRDTEVLDLDGREVTIHAGEFVIGDVKTGDNLEHPWLEILVQEAIYAHAVNENGVAVQDVAGGPFRWAALTEFGAKPVREDVGVVMHVPYGQGEAHFYAADLITGWRGALICKSNREFWKIRLPKVPIATYVVGDNIPAIRYEDHPQDVQDRQDARAAHEGTLATPEERDAAMAKILADVPELCPGCRHEEHLGTCDCGCFNGTEMVPGAPAEAVGSEPPARNIMDVVHSATQDRKESPVGKSKDQWTEEFRAVRTREEANDLWRRAKEAGLPAAEIKRLVALVQLEDRKPQEAPSRPPEPAPAQPVAETGGSRPAPAQSQDGPTLTERAHAVTTKAEASKIFHEANGKIAKMPVEKQEAAKAYRDKLVSIMQTRLKSI